jgi:hypothetical protein
MGEILMQIAAPHPTARMAVMMPTFMADPNGPPSSGHRTPTFTAFEFP